MHTPIICRHRRFCEAYDEAVTEQPDLAAPFAGITERLLAAEKPLLAAHGLSMWAYIVLCQLSASTAGSQLVLAGRIGYDKTRLIKLLDELTDAALVERHPIRPIVGPTSSPSVRREKPESTPPAPTSELWKTRCCPSSRGHNSDPYAGCFSI